MITEGGEKLRRALARFDSASFILKHGGFKESRSPRSYEYLARHPACGSTRLRFNAYKGTWICWGCKETGDVLELIEALERTTLEGSIDFVLAVEIHKPVRVDRLKPIQWPIGVEQLVEPSFPGHARAWQYLFGRGLSVEHIRSYKLSVGRNGRLKDRILFPVYMDHALVYWQARAMWDPPALPKEQQREWIAATGYRKTLNPISEDDIGFATASDVVFNYDRACIEPHVVIVEGPFDAIKVGQHAVGLFGKYATPAKLERLRRMRAQRFTVYLDRGAAEREAAQTLAAELAPYAPVFLCEPPEGRDAGDLDPVQNAVIVASARPYEAQRRLVGIGEKM